jgi:hypothetical protein
MTSATTAVAHMSRLTVLSKAPKTAEKVATAGGHEEEDEDEEVVDRA